jgi:hypothetical protein
MVRNKRVVLSLVLVLSLLSSGCPKDPYRAAIQGSADVSQAVSSAIKITTAYYSNGTINDGQKATVAKYLTIVTDCNMTFRKAVVEAHTAGATGASAYLPVANSFVVCAQSSAPAIGNSTVQNYLKAVETAISGIGLAVQSAKGA